MRLYSRDAIAKRLNGSRLFYWNVKYVSLGKVGLSGEKAREMSRDKNAFQSQKEVRRRKSAIA